MLPVSRCSALWIKMVIIHVARVATACQSKLWDEKISQSRAYAATTKKAIGRDVRTPKRQFSQLSRVEFA